MNDEADQKETGQSDASRFDCFQGISKARADVFRLKPQILACLD